MLMSIPEIAHSRGDWCPSSVKPVQCEDHGQDCAEQEMVWWTCRPPGGRDQPRPETVTVGSHSIKSVSRYIHVTDGTQFQETEQLPLHLGPEVLLPGHCHLSITPVQLSSPHLETVLHYLLPQVMTNQSTVFMLVDQSEFIDLLYFRQETIESS